MNILKTILVAIFVMLSGFATSSCNDDNETDSFMVRYTAFVPDNATNCTVKYLDKVADAWIPVTVENVRGKFVKEIGPVYRGFVATISAGDMNQAYECQIEVSENGGPYQVKLKRVSPTTYEIE